MPRIITTITDKQSGNEENKTKATDKQVKMEFVLLDKAEMPVATLIDRDLAEKWVADHKLGAVKIAEKVIVPIGKEELEQ